MPWFDFQKQFVKKLYINIFNLNLGLRISVSFSALNCAQNFFHGNFLCLKVLALNLMICCYNSFLGRGSNRKRSKHGFRWYIDCYVLKRHGAANWEELKRSLCGKENFDDKWKMTVYSWLKVMLLYCPSSSIK